jgi:predicted nucleotidyltransferase
VSELLDREQVISLLTELGSRLSALGHSVEVYVVGGTAMVLSYDRTRLTRDVDAVWGADSPLDRVAADIAEERGLPRDWINDRVRPMLPRVIDEDQAEALVVPGLTVSVASPRHMIAMKARAARDARDLDDLVLLCRREGVDRVGDVLGIADEVWGPGMLRDEVVFVLREGLTERGLQP